MLINREFFYRGWLPAGLVLNARLITTAKPGTSIAVLKPVINPYPGKGWPTMQPAPVFPIEQATEDQAIILCDPFPDGALVLTVVPEWMGSGSPCILATNTWYEGRIRSVSGSDVMGIRIVPTAYDEYYSYYGGGITAKDVRVFNMPCHHIVGVETEQILAVDSTDSASSETGFPPYVTVNGDQAPARVVNMLSLSSHSFAGMMSVYADLNPSTEHHIIQCEVVDGKLGGTAHKYVGLIAAPKAGKQAFYIISTGFIDGGIEVIGAVGPIGSVAKSRGWSGSDQVVHYN